MNRKVMNRVGLFAYVVLVVVGLSGLSLSVVSIYEKEMTSGNWVESLEFGQTLKANQGFYKGHEFKITGISPIQLNGPVELKLSKSEAYEMFKETK